MDFRCLTKLAIGLSITPLGAGVNSMTRGFAFLAGDVNLQMRWYFLALGAFVQVGFAINTSCNWAEKCLMAWFRTTLTNSYNRGLKWVSGIPDLAGRSFTYIGLG